MIKYNINDEFYLDGEKGICNEKLRIVQILPSLKENEILYLAICNRDSDCNGSFSNAFYCIHSENVLENTYIYQGKI